jgi:hypothetical protein
MAPERREELVQRYREAITWGEARRAFLDLNFQTVCCLETNDDGSRDCVCLLVHPSDYERIRGDAVNLWICAPSGLVVIKPDAAVPRETMRPDVVMQ